MLLPEPVPPRIPSVVPDIPVHGRLDGAGFVLFLFRIHDVADAVDADAGLGHFADHPAQLAHRPDQHAVVADKGNIFAAGDASLQAEEHTEDNHQHNLEAGEDVG